MAVQVGDLFYKIRADTRSLRTATGEIRKFSVELERASGFASRLEKSIQAVSATGARAGNAIASSFKATQIKAIEGARREFERLGDQIRKSSTGSVQSLGALTRSFTSFERAAKKATSIEQLVRSQERFNNVSARQQRVLRSTEQALKQRNEAERRAARDIATTRREVNTLVADLRKAGAQDAEIRRLVKAFQEFRTAAQGGRQTATEFAQLQERMAKASDRSAQKLKELNRAAKLKQIDAFKSSMEAATKSVVLALGPLSGVAARITALSGLFRSNVLILASLLAGLTALGVLLQRAAKAGEEAQRDMFKVSGVLAAMGDSAAFAASELAALNDIAVRVGRETLASAGGARKAEAILLTFGKVGREIFEETLFAAQGLSTVMGGELAINVRRLGRLLQDPTRNLDALTRAGIQFSKAEERVIKQLQATGKAFIAQEIILKRLKPLTQAGRDETLGLAGAFDTLGENVNIFLEAVAGVSRSLKEGESAIGDISNIVKQLADEFVVLSEQEEIVSTLSVLLSSSVAFLGNTLLFVIRNVDLLSAAILGLIGGTIIKAAIVNFGVLTAVIANATARMVGMARVMTTLKVLFRTLLGPIGLVIGLLTAVAFRMFDTTKKAIALARSVDDVKRELEALSKLSITGREIVLTGLVAEQQQVLNEHLEFLRNAVIESGRSVELIGVGDPIRGAASVAVPRLNEIGEAILKIADNAKSLREIDFAALSPDTLEEILLVLQKMPGASSEFKIVIKKLAKELLTSKRATELFQEALDALGDEGKSKDSLADLQDSFEDLTKDLAPAAQAVLDFIDKEKRLTAVLEAQQALFTAQEVTLRGLAEQLAEKGIFLDVDKELAGFKRAFAELRKILKELREDAALDILEDDAKEAFEEFEDGAKEAQRELKNLLEQERLLATQGILAVEELVLMQEMAERTIELKEEIEDLTETALAGLAERLGLVGATAEELAAAQAAIELQSARAADAIDKQTAALEAFEDAMPEAIDELMDLQKQLKVFEEQGIKAFEELVATQEIRKAGEEMAKLAENFPGDQQTEELRRLKAEFPEITVGARTLEEALRKIGETTEQMQQRVEAATSKTNDFAELLGASFESLFESAIAGGEGFREVIGALIQDLVKLTLRLLVIKPLIEALTGFFGGGAAIGKKSTTTQTGLPLTKPGVTIATAKGAVFNRAGLVPFAGGGLITQPTVFPFKGGVGLAGEAGAEAILPLVRRRGKLGVEGGGKGGINIEINAPGADEGTVARIRGIIEVELVPQIIKASTQNTINRLRTPRFS